MLLFKIFSTSDAAAIFTFYLCVPACCCTFLLASHHLIPDPPRRKSLSALHNAFKNVSICSICSHSVAYPFLFYFLFLWDFVWAVGSHFGCWATFFAYYGVGRGSHAGRHFFLARWPAPVGYSHRSLESSAGFLQLFFASYSPPLCHLVPLLIG